MLVKHGKSKLRDASITLLFLLDLHPAFDSHPEARGTAARTYPSLSLDVHFAQALVAAPDIALYRSAAHPFPGWHLVALDYIVKVNLTIVVSKMVGSGEGLGVSITALVITRPRLAFVLGKVLTFLVAVVVRLPLERTGVAV